VRNLHWTSL